MTETMVVSKSAIGNAIFATDFLSLDISFSLADDLNASADGINDEGVKNIFIAKGRAQDNPVILHISDMDMLSQIVYTNSISELEYRLMEAFWPGPFTIILNKKKS
ncbi:MAG: Sua5/YciO/YrdC/YwlC family protein, partial [Clostridia bacterium]|nr:Sua5/YciO/YrdC/YwlC family protein [Clostridia bacterium]